MFRSMHYENSKRKKMKIRDREIDISIEFSNKLIKFLTKQNSCMLTWTPYL